MDAANTWSVGRFLKEALRPRRLRGMFDPRARRRYEKYARAKLRAIASPSESTQGATVSPVYERPFRSLVERGVPILQVFGDDDSSYVDYLAAASGPLADALEAAGDRVQVLTIPGKVHGFLTPPIQDAVVQTVVAWAAKRRRVADPPV